MAFEKADIRTPTSIGWLTIMVGYQLHGIDDNGNPTTQNIANYEVEVLDQNGERMRVRGDIGDLAPVLSAAELQQLITFIQNQKAKAQAAFIG